MSEDRLDIWLEAQHPSIRFLFLGLNAITLLLIISVGFIPMIDALGIFLGMIYPNTLTSLIDPELLSVFRMMIFAPVYSYILIAMLARLDEEMME